MSDSSGLSSLGNFKGVMLCNRPAQIPGSLQTLSGPSGGAGPHRPAFVSAVVADEALGLPPVRHQRVAAARPRASQKLKADDVTWRHKRWLGEFGERRAAISDTLARRQEDQEERRLRLAARAQAMRDAIRGIKADAGGDRESAAAGISALLGGRGAQQARFGVPQEYTEVSQQFPHGAGAYSSSAAAASEEKEEQSSQIWSADDSASASAAASTRAASKQKSKAAAKAASKPGWARTSAEDDDVLDAEADELLSFASGLDYQAYMDDLEVREALRFVQDRVNNLEAAQQTAEAHESERRKMVAAGELEEVLVVDEAAGLDERGEPIMRLITRRVKKNRQALNASHLASDQAGDDGAGDEQQSERDWQAQQEALSRTMLDSNRGLRNVHSSASVRAIMNKQQTHSESHSESFSRTSNSMARTQLATIVDEPLQPPVIATINERESKAGQPTNPSNLPFLYRHPGI